MKYRCKEYVSEGIFHPVFYGDLVQTKDGERRSEFRFRLVGLENGFDVESKTH